MATVSYINRVVSKTLNGEALSLFEWLIPKMAVTYADMAGADPQTICEAACWANTCMFDKFYQLDAIANSNAAFGRRVLMLASSSTLAPHCWGGYRITRKHFFHQ